MFVTELLAMLRSKRIDLDQVATAYLGEEACHDPTREGTFPVHGQRSITSKHYHNNKHDNSSYLVERPNAR